MGGYLPQVFERFGADYPAVMEAFRGLAERLQLRTSARPRRAIGGRHGGLMPFRQRIKPLVGSVEGRLAR